jgi:hypothetical protein
MQLIGKAKMAELRGVPHYMRNCAQPYPNSLGSASLLDMSLCRLLLCARRQQDTAKGLFLAHIHFHEHPVPHWGHSLVLQQRDDVSATTRRDVLFETLWY